MKKKIALKVIAASCAFAMAAGMTTTVSFAATTPKERTLTVTKNSEATYKVYEIAKAIDVVYDTDGTTEKAFTFQVTDSFAGFFGADKASYGNYSLNDYGEILNSSGTVVATMGLTYDKATYSTTADAAQLASYLEKYATDEEVTGADVSASAIEAGYYLVAENATTGKKSGHIASKPVLVSLAGADKTVTPKQDQITFTKKIVEGGKDYTKQSAAKDDYISYKLTSAIPTYAANVDTSKLTFTVADTLDAGLTYGSGTSHPVTVKVGGTALVKDTGYTITTSGQKMTITLEPATIAANQGKAVEITYDAQVNASAVVDSETGNKNSAVLTFTNNAGMTKSTDTLSGSTQVFTYAIKTKKVDASENGVQGAVYTLTKKDGTQVGTYTTGSDGTIDIKGLDEGDYILTETTAPNGFAKLTDPIKFTIADGSDNNNLDGVATFTITSNDSVGDAKFPDNKTTYSENGNGTIDAVMTISGRKGITLPETGSTEARNLMVAGGAAVVIGGLVMVCSRKKKED